MSVSQAYDSKAKTRSVKEKIKREDIKAESIWSGVTIADKNSQDVSQLNEILVLSALNMLGEKVPFTTFSVDPNSQNTQNQMKLLQ